MNAADDKRSQSGALYGIAAYGLWGLFPLYFKAVAAVAPVELLAHRALWSFVMLTVIVRSMDRWGEIRRELHSPKLMLMLAVSSVLIAVNWLLFLWAVINNHVVQASLGYFINPLVNVMLGVAFFRERPRPYQLVSIAIALVGVGLYTLYLGEFPWIAMVLALTFGFYGLMRKLMPVDGLVSLTVETLCMAPFALAWLTWLGCRGELTGATPGLFALLMFSGPVTTIPLLFFGAAMRRLRLSTMGIIQYLSPSLQFSLAVIVFREPFSSVQLICFLFIWIAIAIYTVDSYRAHRENRHELLEPFGAEP